MESVDRSPAAVRTSVRRAADNLDEGEENVRKKTKYDDGTEPDLPAHGDASVDETVPARPAGVVVGTSASVSSCEKLPPENGIVEVVELRNFMCHDNLKIEFGTGINFVTGRNGSGKSAIMTGIVVGLGGAAAQTKRAQSLKALIKKGCSSSTVTVRLHNSSCDPFCHSKYGDSIVVERKLSADGSGQYKLKSHDGRIVASTKDELLRILDYFNIQVNNPVSILNQDTSRNFLHSSKSTHKYELFMKATQLEQLNVNYGQILEQREMMSNSLEFKKDHLPELQREVMVWEEKFKALADLDELIQSRLEVERMIVWAKVAEMERESHLKAEEIEKKERSVPKYTKKVDQYKSEVVKTEIVIQDLEKDLANVNEEAEEIRHKFSDMTKDLRQKKEAINKAKRELREIEQECQSKQRERDGLQTQLEEMATTSTNSRGEKDRRDARKRELEAEVSRIRDEMKAHEARRGDLEETMHKKNETNRELEYKTKKWQSEVEKCGWQMSRLERNHGDKLQVFGDWMHCLVDAVDSERRFHKKPRGPLALYLKLKEAKWALGVETVLGPANLLAFCCHDQHDFQLLKRLMTTHCNRGREPNIIMQKFKDQCYDIRHTRPRCDHPVFFDIVECRDPVVFNALVDQCTVENILMIEQPEVARRVMFDSVPRGAKEAITLDGDRIRSGGAKQFYSVPPDRKVMFLHESVEMKIQAVRERQRALQEELRKHQEDQRHNSDEKRHASRELEQVKVQLRHKEQQMKGVRGELQELSLMEDDVVPIDVASLEEELEQHNDQIGLLTQHSQSLSEEREEMSHQYDEQKKQQGMEGSKGKEILDKMEQIKGELEQSSDTAANLRRHQRHYEQKHHELMEDINSKRQEFDAMELRLVEETEKAEQVCERMETDRTARDLETELRKKNSVIAEKEKVQGSREEITLTYLELKERYANVEKIMKSLRRCRMKLVSMMTQRVKEMKAYKRLQARQISSNFHTLLKRRGYNGKMTFDHDKKQLTLEVKVEQASKSAMTKDMKALSGGERMLDEFDVFMDMVNRRVSMAMLLEEAKAMYTKQYVFLTPQDLSHHIGDADIRIHRLTDPERDN